MKRIFLLFTIFSVTSNLCAVQPNWIKNPPKSNYPDEYKYSVAVGTGRSENEARIDAEEQMTEQVYKVHGCQNRNEIEYWQADGFRVRTEQGITYVTRDEEGIFHYYMLYIYATKPKFYKQAHWECRQGKEKSDLASVKMPNTQPSYWSEYADMSTYLSVEKMHLLEKGQTIQNVTDSLFILSQQMLIEKYKDYDAEEFFPTLICNDYFYDKKKKEVHVVSYVRKSSLKNLYNNNISNIISVTIDNEIKDAQSFEKTEDWDIATAMYEKVQEQCDKTVQCIEQHKKIAGENPLTAYYTNEIKNIRDTIRNSLTNLRKKATPDREERIRKMLEIAQEAEFERKLEPVLKYYYGALAYMARYPQLETLQMHYDYTTLGRPWDTNQQNTPSKMTLKDWLPEHIRKILREINVQCYKDENDNYKLHLIFSWPDNSLATDGTFCFNLYKGAGWSYLYSIKDGEGEFDTREKPQEFDVRLEYKYTEQWHSDEVIRNEVKNAMFDFNSEATHHVIVENSRPKHAPITTNKGMLFAQTNSAKETAATGSPLKKIISSEEKVYKEAIARVCESIKTKDYTTIQNTFTSNGYKLFMNFVNEGHVVVRNSTQYQLISIWDEVYARSIKMDIQFHSKKQILTKNVVFVFDKDKKIDGIQFALDDITIQDIKSQENWSEEMKFAVMNFIENYQTAYNLKRLDYIQSVFSDDAIIIVGQVVPVATKVSDSENINNFKTGNSQKVKYYKLSKEEYMNRLKRVFASNEWININFANVNISQHPDREAESVYGLGLKQDYSSQHYGDTGYLFLVVDMNDQQKPIIHLRVWTPEAKFGWPQYLQMLKEDQETK